MTDAKGLSEVQRYDAAEVYNAYGDDPTCTYVKYSDYTALAERLKHLTAKYQAVVAAYDKHLGTPCEQIRHQHEVDDLKERLKVCEQERSLAEDERIEWVKRGERAEEMVAQLTADLAAMRKQLELADSDAKNMKACWDAACNDLASARAEVERLKSANEHWHMRIRQLKTDNEAYSESNERLKAALVAAVELLSGEAPSWSGQFVLDNAHAALKETT